MAEAGADPRAWGQPHGVYDTCGALARGGVDAGIMISGEGTRSGLHPGADR